MFLISEEWEIGEEVVEKCERKRGFNGWDNV